MKHVLIFGGVVICLLVLANAMAIESRDQAASQMRTIALSDIITTGPQKELRRIDDVLGPAEAYNPFMMRFRNVDDGSSNVFLVEATSLPDALAASSNIFFGSRSANTPSTIDNPKPKRGEHWLVAYLGSGPSNPPWWTIESVSVESAKVILRYRRPKPQPATDDVRRYHFWIPLGKLDPGVYKLELVDIGDGAITLMRRVEVASNTEEKGGAQ